ncbi:unnamed protein product [Closterium sp. NIES-53]
MSPVASSFVADLLSNEPLVAASTACVVAQCLKPVIAAASGDGFNWRLVFKSGGMPSSHSAVVTALATSIYFERGASDALFGATVVFATIVMYDAQGVRGAVGKQAQVINSLVVPQLVRPPTLSSIRNSAASLSKGTADDNDRPSDTSSSISSSSGGGRGGSNRTSGGGSSSSSSGDSNSQTEEQQGWKRLFPWLKQNRGPGPEVSPVMGDRSGNDDVSDAEGRLAVRAATLEGIDWDDSRISAYISPSSSGSDSESSRLPEAQRWRRSRTFWAAVFREPAVVEGEVEVQEIGQLEGWRNVPLKESVGHTKAEVVGGAVAGVLLSLLIELFS